MAALTCGVVIVSVALPDKRAEPREFRLIGKTKRFFNRNGIATQTLRVLQEDPRCIAAERGDSHPQLPEHTGRPSAAADATSESCVGAESKASLGCWVNAQKRLELSTCCHSHHHPLMPHTIHFHSVDEAAAATLISACHEAYQPITQVM